MTGARSLLYKEKICTRTAYFRKQETTLLNGEPLTADLKTLTAPTHCSTIARAGARAWTWPSNPGPSHQFGLQLVLTVAVPQAPVSPFAPCVEVPSCCDTGTVGSTSSDINHFDSSQGLNDTRAVTWTAEDKYG